MATLIKTKWLLNIERDAYAGHGADIADTLKLLAYLDQAEETAAAIATTEQLLAAEIAKRQQAETTLNEYQERYAAQCAVSLEFSLTATAWQRHAEQADATLAQLKANWATIPLDDLHQIANETQLASWSSIRYLRDWLASLQPPTETTP